MVFRSWVFFILLLKVVMAAATVSFWTVKYLPGFSGPLPFQLETGYVGVGDWEEVQLFYYFVKSQGNPQKDPLMTWYIGGPGCSALNGLFEEIGPLNFKLELYNGTLPQLILNPHTWVKKASILFIDTPVYSGFSYSRTPQGSKKGDFRQIEQNHQFLRKWFEAHPEFLSNPFYVGGSSYSGIIVPPITQAISEGNKHVAPVINLQGYIVGNPVTIPNAAQNVRIPFAYSMNLISTKLYKLLTSNCKGEYVKIDPNNVECLKYIATFKKCVDGINCWCILLPFCVAPIQRIERRRSLYNTSELAPKALPANISLDCLEYKHNLNYYWANDDRVQKALHIREGTIKEWVRCNITDDYEYDLMSVVPYHANLSLKGYRSLVFSGDHDMTVATISTQTWIESLNYSIVDDWRPWFSIDDQILGYTTTYANNMTFVTIKGGGHTPEYMPHQCDVMFSRWIKGEAL